MLSNIETFLGCNASYDKATIAVFGAPFDSTTSFRPGTRFAGHTMRSESWGLETYSPYQNRDMEDLSVFDCGELELCFGSPELALDAISNHTAQLLADGKLPFMIGGEHLVTLGSLREVAKQHKDLAVIHLDAHTDLRENYLGQKLSHASVIRRVWEIVGDGSIYQFGIRSGEREEFEWAKSHTVLHPFDFDGIENAVIKLQSRPVYFTLDLDVMDPAYFPGTGTPEPGGVSFLELMHTVTLIGSSLNIVGADMVELCPACDPTGASTAAACKIMREFLLAVGIR